PRQLDGDTDARADPADTKSPGPIGATGGRGQLLSRLWATSGFSRGSRGADLSSPPMQRGRDAGVPLSAKKAGREGRPGFEVRKKQSLPARKGTITIIPHARREQAEVVPHPPSTRR